MKSLETNSSFVCPLAIVAVLLLLPAPLHADTVQYTYDLAGRVVSADYGGGKTIAHTYDPAGNVLQRQFSAGSADTDDDGMDDSWEILYFGDKDTHDGTGDYDHDGASTLAEFLAGTLPNDPNSALKVLPKPTVGASSVTTQWASVAGKKYRLRFKNSLSTSVWTDVPGDVTATGATSSKMDSTLNGGTGRFYRVQLAP